MERGVTRPDFADTDGEQGFIQAATVTLSNGDRVRSDSLMWKDECLQRHRHVENLRRLSVVERRAYVSDVAHREGNEAGKRLTAAYAADFEKRRAAEAAARAQVAP